MKKRQRRRYDHPIEIRRWVLTDNRTERDPEEIHKTLRARQRALDKGIAPYRHAIVKVNDWIAAESARRLGLPPPATTAEVKWAAVRVVAGTAVANYYRRHPYRRRHWYPTIVVSDTPHAVPPDKIHILDLPAARIRAALRRNRRLQRFRLVAKRLGTISARAADLLHLRLLYEVALDEILVYGAPGAVYSGPFFQRALALFLHLASQAASDEEADEADDYARDLWRELEASTERPLADLHPDRLRMERAEFLDRLQRARELKYALKQRDIQRARVLAQSLFRRSFTAKAIRGLRRRWPDGIAVEVLADELHLSTAEVRKRRRLADKAENIDEAWRDWLKLPEGRRRELFPFFSVPSRVVKMLGLAPQTLAALERAAARAGMDPATFLTEIIDKHLSKDSDVAAATPRPKV